MTQTILIIIGVVIVLVFVLTFLMGAISAALLGNKKNRRAHAIVLLSQLPQGLIKDMVLISSAHKNNDIDEANKITSTIGSDALGRLFKLVGPENRSKEFSSGKFGDSLSWTAMENELQDRGYTINSSKIVTGIVLYDLDIVLMEIESK